MKGFETYLRSQEWDDHRRISQTEFWSDSVHKVVGVEGQTLQHVHLCLRLNHQSWKLLDNWSQQKRINELLIGSFDAKTYKHTTKCLDSNVDDFEENGL